MKAILMLEDGKGFSGEAISAGPEKIGEVVFNTAVVGYQEMLTTPANAGKILVFTYPLIGNYGCAPKFNESHAVWPCGLVIKEKSRIVSNWQATQSLDDFIKEHNLSTITKVDTRTLAVHLRQKSQIHMLGIISTSCFDAKELVAKIKDSRKVPQPSFLPGISVKKITTLKTSKPKAKKIAVLDLGVTKSILRQLEALGFFVTLLPYGTGTADIVRLKPLGLVISDGPEEDPGLQEVVQNIKPLIGVLPVLAISTGHQVLARALGGQVSRMHLGHRGVNYPVRDPLSWKGEITVQNHGHVVEAYSLQKIKEVKITARNSNDQTIEEIESRRLKFIGVQYYPASPGFDEVHPAFIRFANMINRSI